MKNLSELEIEIMQLCKNNERDYEQTVKVLREYEDVVAGLSNALKTQLEEQEKKVDNLIQQLKKQKQLKQAINKNVADLEFKKMSFDYLKQQLLTQNHGEH